MERIAPSARLEGQIEELLSHGVDDNERLAELGRLGTRLVLQRAVEDEVTAFLSRARYERTPAATGSRNGSRSKAIQTAEGEISIAIPQVRGTVERFVSRIIPDVRSVVRTRPLEALVIGAYVRGLSIAISRACWRRLDWATCPRTPPASYAASCALATPRSAPRAWPTSSCWRCIWMRCTCRRARVAAKRACWWPGVTSSAASECCWRSASVSANHARIGWTSVEISPDVACAVRG